MIKKAKEILKQVFGYDEFRPYQEDIISSVLNRKDTLAIIPTGGGKSICFQIPAMILKGVTLVVSPLISLMKDQTDQLDQYGIPSVFLNSSLGWQEYQYRSQLVLENKVKILYLAPESLLTDRMLELLNKVKIDLIAVDEAHCISEWGHDFRPDYRNIVQIREKFKDATILAMTATATERVREDIMTNLKFRNHEKFIASFNRDNLFLDVATKSNPVKQTISFLQKFKDQSGIIYCTSRSQVEELAEILQDKGYSVLPYHAGLDDKTRRLNQEKFIKDEIKIIVATIAFGMGINKHNVRFVIHYDLPKSIESYYQEIGRSGRDGLISHCLLLFGYGDISKIKYFISKTENESEKKVAQQHLDAIIRYAEAKKCKRIPLLKYFGEDYKEEKCGMCVNCISEKIEIRDLTIEAQKFLSCVFRTGQKFGAGHIIDVLRGSENEKVLSYRHHELSTYNIGKELSKKQWMQVSRQLIEYDFLELTDEYNILKLKPKATDLFKKKITFFGVVDEAEKDYEKVVKSEIQYDKKLFDILKKLRLELADKYKIPAFAIFPDRTLLEMASEYPRTKTEMMKIHGMGTVKYAKFGDMFLKKVVEYIKNNNIEVKKDLTSDDYEQIPKQNAKCMLVGKDFQNGMTIKELCKKYSFQPRTATDNLHKFTLSGNKLDKTMLKNEINISEDIFNKAIKAYRKHGTLSLKVVFDEFNGEVTYEQLGLIRLFVMNSEDK